MSGVGATPRINQQHLQEFVNKTVRIVGRVDQLRGETAVIDAEGPITVHLNQDSHLFAGQAAEIIGKVRPDLSVSVMRGTDFGEKFDYAAANAVVAVTHKFPEIFYTGSSMADPSIFESPKPAEQRKPRTYTMNTDDDAQLLLEELEAFEMQSSMHKVTFDEPELDLGVGAGATSLDEVDGTCTQHPACNMRRETAGPDNFVVHAFEDEELWVWVPKQQARARRRKSHV